MSTCCGRCGLPLSPGSKHADALGCLEAVLHDRQQLLDSAATCRTCKVKPACLCTARRVAQSRTKGLPVEAQIGLRVLGELLRPE